jgi:broad specificity phosphatase PhoE
LRTLLLVRHAQARTNVEDAISSTPPGAGLTPRGIEEAVALRTELAERRIDVAVATRLMRTQETLEVALAGRNIPRVVLPELDEIRFGSFEGGPLERYRAWAWSHPPDAPCPGGGESRPEAAVRYADGLEALLARPEDVVLAVSHSLAVRYTLDASDGIFPAARVPSVGHATPHELPAAAVARAAETLRAWAAAPTFTDEPPLV